jgi:hypothetical protein
LRSQVLEPCEVCGEETAVGSVFYSDRRVTEDADGHRGYICTLCDQRISASRPVKRLNEDESRHLLMPHTLGVH